MPDTPTYPSPALAPEVLDALALELTNLRHELLTSEVQLAEELEAVHRNNLPSARNLVHYLALRRHDLRGLQRRLARVGLSSLGRSESHVLVTIDRVLAMLALARDATPPDAAEPPLGFRQGERKLAANARRLLGPRPADRPVRIMVTLPSEAAEDARLVDDLVAAGMDCARINCAHDDAAAWRAMAENVRAARRAHERDCRLLADLGGPKPRTGPVASGAKHLLLSIDDRFELVPAEAGGIRREGSLPRIACTTRGIFRNVRPGQAIWFDDGDVGGVLEECSDDRILIHVTAADPKGSKLRPDRGINLPDSELVRPAPTPKDLRDLEEVVSWADAVELSFVERPEDVLALHDALGHRNADRLGVVLKIETRRGFEELPRLLITAMRRRSCGVMIARGDLAVEMGFERMAEVQEEILWIAEAAHVPTIWATQVLDNLAKKGRPSRAEMTDAAMSARAEAVMLNKGPFILEAMGTLDEILSRMAAHQSKKRSLYRALRVSKGLFDD